MRKTLKRARRRVVAPSKKKDDSQTWVQKFFCLPLGFDPRPRDQSTWILWSNTSLYDLKSKRREFESWIPQDGFLTRDACQRQSHTMEQDIKKGRKEGVYPENEGFSYMCLPSGVEPWGRELQR